MMYLMSRRQQAVPECFLSPGARMDASPAKPDLKSHHCRISSSRRHRRALISHVFFSSVLFDDDL
jgi:hypothetical protein